MSTIIVVNPFMQGGGDFFTPDPDALAYIQAVEAADGQALEPATRLAINTFVAGCKADGIWSAMQSVVILAGARTRAGALVPLKGTAPTEHGTSGGWSYNRETGLLANGTDNYLNSQRAGNADSQNSKHIALYSNGSGTTITMGTRTTTGATYMDTLSPGFRCRIHSSTAGDDKTVSPAPHGFLAGSRSAVNTISFRYNNSAASGTVASEVPQSETILVYARRNNTTGNPELFTAGRYAFYSIGGALTLSSLEMRVNTLMADLAAAIP